MYVHNITGRQILFLDTDSSISPSHDRNKKKDTRRFVASVDNDKLMLFYCSNRDPLFVEFINYALNKLENSNNENITTGATNL